MQLLKQWPRQVVPLPFGIIRKYFLKQFARGRSYGSENPITLLTGRRNEAAVEKANKLAQMHGIKAVAYKVDSELFVQEWLGTAN